MAEERRYPIVIVKWVDIVGRLGWHSQNTLDNFITDETEPVVYQTGYLYEEDEHQIVLIDSYFHGATQYGTIHRIPRGCIIEITHLP